MAKTFSSRRPRKVEVDNRPVIIVSEADDATARPTPETVNKFNIPTVDRLVAKHKIGAEEMRAIQEIDAVYMKLSVGLKMKGPSMDRVDGGKGGEPIRLIDAYYLRYKPWAKEWSMRRNKYGDVSLEIVFDILFSNVNGGDIDAKFGWRKGKAVDIFVAAVRDYAAMAGWADPATGARWQTEARAAFPQSRLRKRSA